MRYLEFNVVETTNLWNGINAKDFFRKSFLDSPTVRNIKIVPGVKDLVNIPFYSAGTLMQSTQCTINEQGSGGFGQKQFSVCSKQVLTKICLEDIENSFLSEQLKEGSNNPEVAPQSFISFMVDTLKAKLAEEIEIVTWRGVGSGSTEIIKECVGFEKLMDDSTEVLDVTGTTSAITSSNLSAELVKLYNTIPAEINFKPDMGIFLPTYIYKLYQVLLGSTSLEKSFAGSYPDNYLGVPLYHAPGMSANRMVAARKDTDLIFLTDLFADQENLRLLPQFDRGEDIVIVKGRFKIGYGLMNESQIVSYKTS